MEVYKINIKPFLSINIKTTGLDPENDMILSIGAVYVDGTSNLEFEDFNYTNRITGSIQFIAMNSKIIDHINKSGNLRYSDRSTRLLITRFEYWLRCASPSAHLTLAGNNVVNFDLPFLKKAGWMRETSHRVIDVGSMYYNEFGYIPSLGEINNLIGYKPVAHTALADAINVVEAIKHKVKSKTKRKTL